MLIRTDAGLVATDATLHRLYHGRYSYEDVQVTIRHSDSVAPVGGGPSAGVTKGIILKRVTATSMLVAYIGSTSLVLAKLDGGSTFASFATLNSTAVTALTIQDYWLRARIEGNVVTVEHFTAPPTPMGTPANTFTQQLSAADAFLFGAGISGQAGIWWEPGTSFGGQLITDFDVKPYTYRNRTLPEEIRLGGPIPGDAPAKADLIVTPSGGTDPPAFCAAAFYGRSPTWNRVFNGDFEADTSGWTTAAAFNIQAGAGTSITRVTTDSKYGTCCAEVVCPATASTGANFRIIRRFRRGVTYTALFWVRAPAGSTTGTGVRIGNNSANDKATSTFDALTATWTLRTITWVPAADYDEAHVAAIISTATATTFRIDGVCVVEGVLEPTVGRHREGAGGQPPVGIIEAEHAVDVTTWTAGTLTGASRGEALKATPSGAGTATATYMLDPSLMDAEPFSGQQLSVEVWAKIYIASTVVSPRLTASLINADGTSYGQERFGELTSLGAAVVLPSSGTQFRGVRLGVLTATDEWEPQRWKLKIAASWAAGSTGTDGFSLDQLCLLPAKQRAVSPTRKALDGNYPRFTQSTAETTRKIGSSLRGWTRKPGLAGWYPDTPLGGTPFEPRPGDTDLLLKLSSLVPDDPSSVSTSEQLNHSATVHVAVTPRALLAATL